MTDLIFAVEKEPERTPMETDIMSQYLKEAGPTPIMSKEEEIECAERIKCHREKIWKAARPLLTPEKEKTIRLPYGKRENPEEKLDGDQKGKRKKGQRRLKTIEEFVKNLCKLSAEWEELEREVERTTDSSERQNKSAGIQKIREEVGVPKAELVSILKKTAPLERELRQIKEEFLKANLRLVVSVAKRFQGYPLPLPDLIQEGNEGLMRALDLFDLSRKTKFSTYATWWIRQAIMRAVADTSRIIRVPVHVADSAKKIGQAFKALADELGRKPTIEEVAEWVGKRPETIRQALNAVKPMVQLDEEVGEDGSSNREPLLGFFEDPNSIQPFEVVRRVEVLSVTKDLLSQLPQNEEIVIRGRLGIGREKATLEEIGRELKLTRERIRQIEVKAIKRLRGFCRKKRMKLEDYLA